VPSTVPTVKKGLRAWLAALPGLLPADGVTVRSAPINPDDQPPDLIVLTDVTAPQSYDLMDAATKTERATLTGYVVVTRPGSDETAVDAARDRAYALFAVLEAALEADPGAGGVIPGPLKGELTEAGLSESATDSNGQGARQAQVRWLLAWTSDY
jgi:hypothetical protein